MLNCFSLIMADSPDFIFQFVRQKPYSLVAEIHAQAASLLDCPGRLILMKGRYPGDELENPALAGLDLAVHPLRVPFLEGERHLIEIRRE